MLGNELQLPLDRLHALVRDTPAVVPSLIERVAEQQQVMMQWFNRKHRMKLPDLAVQDWV